MHVNQNNIDNDFNLNILEISSRDLLPDLNSSQNLQTVRDYQTVNFSSLSLSVQDKIETLTWNIDEILSIEIFGFINSADREFVWKK